MKLRELMSLAWRKWEPEEGCPFQFSCGGRDILFSSFGHKVPGILVQDKTFKKFTSPDGKNWVFCGALNGSHMKRFFEGRNPLDREPAA